MQIVAALIIIGTSIWVYYDAKAIGIKRGLIKGFFDMEPIEWALCVAGFWLFIFPQYIYMRREYRTLIETPRPKDEAPENQPLDVVFFGEKWLQATLGGAAVCGLLYFSLFFLLGNSLSPIKFLGGEFGHSLSSFIGGVCWFALLRLATAPAAATYLIARKFGQTVVVVKKPEALRGRTKPCPYCAEIIGENAIFCRYCAKDLAALPTTPPKMATKTAQPGPAVQSPATTRPVAPDWLSQGQQLLKAGKAQEAIDALSRAIEKDGASGVSFYSRAVAYSKIADNQSALADLKKAAELGYEPARKYLEKLGK